MLEDVSRPWRERIEGAKWGLLANVLMLAMFAGILAWVWPELPEVVSMKLGLTESEASRDLAKGFYGVWVWMIILGGLIPLLFDGKRGRGLLPARMWATNLTVFAFSATWFGVGSLALYHDATGSYLLALPWAGVVLVLLPVLALVGMVLEERRRTQAAVDAALGD